MNIAKEYTYWLIVWIMDSGEEVHDVRVFSLTGDPKGYCDLLMKQPARNSNGEKVYGYYKYYSIYKLKIDDKDSENLYGQAGTGKRDSSHHLRPARK